MVTVIVSGNAVKVVSPYNPKFVAGAKKLGGRWNAPAWVFDARDEDRVRDLCLDIYGVDGRGPTETRTLRLHFTDRCYADRDAYRIAGKEIARARGRDTGATLGEGVVLLEGQVGSGGSAKNWETVVHPGTVLLVRDVPAAMADSAVESPPRGIEASIEPETVPVDRDALTAERGRLAARIAEIDVLLAGQGG